MEKAIRKSKNFYDKPLKYWKLWNVIMPPVSAFVENYEFGTSCITLIKLCFILFWKNKAREILYFYNLVVKSFYLNLSRNN
jgi:hypothetical protein